MLNEGILKYKVQKKCYFFVNLPITINISINFIFLFYFLLYNKFNKILCSLLISCNFLFRLIIINLCI